MTDLVMVGKTIEVSVLGFSGGIFDRNVFSWVLDDDKAEGWRGCGV